MCAVLGRSRGLCGRSWVALRPSLGGLGQLLRLMWAVLGRSWGLCGQSWAALGLPSPLLAASGHSEVNSLHPPKLNLSQLKQLILAWGFFVKVAKRNSPQRALLALKRPLGDINARGGGSLSTDLPCPYRRPRRIMGQTPPTPIYSINNFEFRGRFIDKWDCRSATCWL